MEYALKTVPQPQAILEAWMPFKQLVGVTSVRTENDYAQVRATIDVLLDEIGDDENHPLADVLDYLADQVKAYEDENFQIPEAEPKEVLRFLMDQHGLKQEDLGDALDEVADGLDFALELERYPANSDICEMDLPHGWPSYCDKGQHG